jgi:cytidine deaminase
MPSTSESSDETLLAAARSARDRAYAPYSNVAVGAALLCEDGTIVTGANVENASYGLSICAERTAVFTAVAAGRTHYRAIAVAGPPEATTSPCGACRQVLAEFGPTMRVLFTSRGAHEAFALDTLLPATFELRRTRRRS